MLTLQIGNLGNNNDLPQRRRSAHSKCSSLKYVSTICLLFELCFYHFCSHLSYVSTTCLLFELCFYHLSVVWVMFLSFVCCLSYVSTTCLLFELCFYHLSVVWVMFLPFSCCLTYISTICLLFELCFYHFSAVWMIAWSHGTERKQRSNKVRWCCALASFSRPPTMRLHIIFRSKHLESKVLKLFIYVTRENWKRPIWHP